METLFYSIWLIVIIILTVILLIITGYEHDKYNSSLDPMDTFGPVLCAIIAWPILLGIAIIALPFCGIYFFW